MTDVILREDIFDIKGTTKLKIGDPSYFEEMEFGSTNKYLKEITFNGNISAAPLGKLRTQLVNHMYEEFECDSIEVTVVQGKNIQQLDTYLSGKCFTNKIKKRYQLGCDTAQFEMVTKYGYDLFHIGADGYYGDLIVNKQYFGMILMLDFDTDLFDYQEIINRMLRLFPIRRERN